MQSGTQDTMNLADTLQGQINAWLARDPDPVCRAELQTLLAQNNRRELAQRFAGRLAFGTAGLRAVMGAGPMRMNRLVVRETTAGLGRYLLASIPNASQRGVVVTFDGRLGSPDFARDAACVLAGLGLRVFLIEQPAPTPLCAFAVTHLRAAGGIMITASHNPKEYNGYKVYWENGAQIIPPHDEGIAVCITDAALQPIPWCDDSIARKNGLISAMDGSVQEAYLQGITALQTHSVDASWAQFSVAYTPLHGVGAALAEEALRRGGLPQVRTVAIQRQPDGHFPTVVFPNPEEPGAMDGVIGLARDVGAAVALANDPDADRLAVAVETRNGNYRVLTGDEIGTLLAHDRIMAYLKTASVRDSACVGTTIVSSRLLQVMAAAHGIAYFETLTGFKWLANEAMERKNHGQVLLLAYEEALGYGVGELVRDKDGISAAVCFAQMAADAAAHGQSILDKLEHIYRSYGIYVTAQKSIQLGSDLTAAGRICQHLREQPPTEIAGFTVESMTDLMQHTCRHRDGRITPVPLPVSDVLIFELSGERRLVMRPSGTEPKFKCYYGLRTAIAADEKWSDAEMRAKSTLAALMDAHQHQLVANT